MYHLSGQSSSNSGEILAELVTSFSLATETGLFADLTFVTDTGQIIFGHSSRFQIVAPSFMELIGSVGANPIIILAGFRFRTLQSLLTLLYRGSLRHCLSDDWAEIRALGHAMAIDLSAVSPYGLNPTHNDPEKLYDEGQAEEEADGGFNSAILVDSMAHHNPAKIGFRCGFCPLIKHTLNELKRHLATHCKAQILRDNPNAKNGFCDQCGQKFQSKFVVVRHLAVVHEAILKYLSPCDYPELFMDGPKKRILSQVPKLPQITHALLQEAYDGLESQQHPCPICGRSFATTSGKKLHFTVHGQNYLLVNSSLHEGLTCKGCPEKVFRNLNNLVHHIGFEHRFYEDHLGS